MKLYLVRHGQTDWNKEKRLQGQEDIPLNDFGRHLAKETGVGLRNVRFNLCFSSVNVAFYKRCNFFYAAL